MLGAALGGCGKATPPVAAPSDTSRPSPGAAGGIISLGPNITETLFALGLGHRIVGRTRYCDYPPEALDITEVGGYLDPNLERITLLRPEWIILQGKPPEVKRFAEANGIGLLEINMDDLASIDEGIRKIGVVFDKPAEADALRARLHAELEAVRAAVRGLPRPKTLIINTRVSHDLNTMFTCGKAAFLAQIVDVAGGENIFHDAAQNYFEASKESVVVRAPEVILEFHAGEALSEDQLEAFKRDWNALPSLPAVKDGRIYLFTESYTLRPGPRVGKTARLLARALHPGVELPEP